MLSRGNEVANRTNLLRCMSLELAGTKQTWPDYLTVSVFEGDSVAKLQKWGATNFPQMDLTSQNRRPMASPGHYRTRL
jgi:hypothetical protein